MKSIRPGNTFVVRKLRLGVGLQLEVGGLGLPRLTARLKLPVASCPSELPSTKIAT